MKISITQIYIQPNINFPFSHLFQKWMAEELTEIVHPSKEFNKKYGEDFSLVFNMSAKAKITDNEIRGPSVFRKTKDVEYSIFLPFDIIDSSRDRIGGAVRYLLSGVIRVLESLHIDATELSRRSESMVLRVRNDITMVVVPGEIRVMRKEDVIEDI